MSNNFDVLCGRRLVRPLLLIGMLGVAPAALAAAQREQVAASPQPASAISPGERRARELIDALATGDPKILSAYLKANATGGYLKSNPEQRLNWARYFMGGKPGLEEYRKQSERDGVAVARNPITKRWNALYIEVEKAEPHLIVRASADPYTLPPESYQPVLPKSEPRRMRAIDSFVQRLAAADRFSGVVLVAKNDKVIFEKAYGLADRALGVRNSVDTRFNVGSIDKMFTALAVAQLVEQGKLSYEDPLSRFIEYPDAETSSKIKLKHLLSHTSGLGDYITPAYDEMRSSLGSMDDYMKLAEKLKPIKLRFEPGKGWAYSNLGMLLVGRIVEKVTGEDYYERIQKVVFDRAGMTTATDLRLGEITPNVASLHQVSFPNGKLNWRNASYELPARSAPDGGSVATARDFVKFAAALRGGTIVRRETFDLMAKPKDELGAKGRYGFGVAGMNQRLGARGRDVIGHGGDTNGGCASFAMVRDAGAPYTIVILSNSFQASCFPVGEVVLEMIPPGP